MLIDDRTYNLRKTTRTDLKRTHPPCVLLCFVPAMYKALVPPVKNPHAHNDGYLPRLKYKFNGAAEPGDCLPGEEIFLKRSPYRGKKMTKITV